MHSRCDVKGRVKRTSEAGFSLLELLVVLAIVLVVTAVAMPMITTTVSNYRLKSAASQVAGMIQQCRIASVRANQSLQMRAATVNGQQQVYVDLNSNSAFNTGEPMMLMPNRITVQTAGYPGDATDNLGTNNAVFYQTAPRFNARGLPCVDVTPAGGGTATCRNIDAGNNAVGFVYYLRSDRTFGMSGWAAVTVTPAGRVRSWFYSGASYQ